MSHMSGGDEKINMVIAQFGECCDGGMPGWLLEHWARGYVNQVGGALEGAQPWGLSKWLKTVNSRLKEGWGLTCFVSGIGISVVKAPRHEVILSQFRKCSSWKHLSKGRMWGSGGWSFQEIEARWYRHLGRLRLRGMYFVLKTMEVIGCTLIKKVRDTALCNLGEDYFSSDFAAGLLGEGRMCYVIASN